MPELPEVETTCRGVRSFVVGAEINSLILNRRDLRWPISSELPVAANGRKILSVQRRGKYMIFKMADGYLLAHLGMSGSIRVTEPDAEPRLHDHWLMTVASGEVPMKVLRFNDPRRFGALFWGQGDWNRHPLIASLGPEPLSDEFDADYLYQISRKRKLPIKSLVMDSKVVVGVGNIYAAESLFHSGIHPALASGKLTRAKAATLVEKIKQVLAAAIEQGGTTLRDYVNGSGKPGYFQQQLWVYGRKDEACKTCGTSIKEIRMGQRSSCFCPACQAR